MVAVNVKISSKASKAISYLCMSDCLSTRWQAIFAKGFQMLTWNEDRYHNCNVHHLREDMQTLHWQQGDTLLGGRRQLRWYKCVQFVQGRSKAAVCLQTSKDATHGSVNGGGGGGWGEQCHQPPLTDQHLQSKSVARSLL